MRLGVLSVILLFWSTQTEASCPPDWEQHHSRCYYLSKSKAKWKNAQNQCAGMGANLVSFHRKEEEELVLKAKTETYWIGLIGLTLSYKDNLETKRENWKWLDGSYYNWMNWAEEMPTAPQFVKLNKARDWDTAGGGGGKYFVCKRKKDSECPSEWLEIGDICYFVSSDKVNWYEAQTECMDEGASLVSLTSQREAENVTSNLDSTRKYWIGLAGKTKNFTEHIQARRLNWEWIDGSPYNWTDWKENKPGKPPKFVYVESSSLWQIDGGEQLHHYLCKKHVTTTTNPNATSGNISTSSVPPSGNEGPTPGTHTNGISAPIGIGVGVALLVIVAIIIVVLVLLKRRRNKKQDGEVEFYSTQNGPNSAPKDPAPLETPLERNGPDQSEPLPHSGPVDVSENTNIPGPIYAVPLKGPNKRLGNREAEDDTFFVDNTVYGD